MVQQTERVACDFSSAGSEKFAITKRDRTDCFKRQYFFAYRARIAALKPRIIDNAKKTIGASVKVVALERVRPGEKCLVIGTLEKRISQRPSVLKELADDDVLDDVYAERCLVSARDYLEFEDENCVVKVGGNVSLDDVATGCVVGLYGAQMHDDVFSVDELVWPTPAPQTAWPAKSSGLVVFLSGLELRGKSEEDGPTLLAMAQLTSWLTGETGEPSSSSSVVRVVIAGESTYTGAQSLDFAKAARTLIRKDTSVDAGAVAELDRVLGKITSHLPVSLIPGCGDPTGQMWPQQPVHRCCLPRASLNGAALSLHTNPAVLQMADCELAVTSGHNVTDLRRLCSVNSAIELMEKTLQWQHYAPTAPDTIDMFPFEDRDPLVMDSYPHVMVCGNQPRADSRLSEGVDGRQCLLLSLPRFSKSHTIAVLNLEDMSIAWKRFGL